MSQQEDKPIKEELGDNAVNTVIKQEPVSIKEEPTKPMNDLSPEQPKQEPVVKKTFYCNCRDCKLYFGKGNPIECVNPHIVEMRYPKWKFVNNSGANRVPLFRRPADPGTRNDNQKVKRRKR